MKWRVDAGYVTVPTAVPGGGRARIDIPRGELLPDDVPSEDIGALSARGAIVPADDDGAEPEVVEPPAGDDVPDGTAAAVIEWVTADPDRQADRARAALEAEQARGEQARKVLTADLAKLAEL